jgi:hypothetical protein
MARRSFPTLDLTVVIFASELDMLEELDEHDSLVRKCVAGEISFDEFCGKYNDFYALYALTGMNQTRKNVPCWRNMSVGSNRIVSSRKTSWVVFVPRLTLHARLTAKLEGLGLKKRCVASRWSNWSRSVRPNKSIATDVLAAGFARLWPAGHLRR